MTQEDIKYLEAYEQHFKTAINSNYTRNVVSSALDRMLEIYQKETGTSYRLCKSCTSSILNFLKQIGKLYFKVVQDGKETNVTVNELEKVVTQKERSECTQMENKKVKKTKK